MDEIEKMKAESSAMQIEAIITSIKHAIPKEHRPMVDDLMPKLLPMIKDLLKKKLDELSEKLGTGPDKKFYVLHNVNGIPELWIMPKKDMKAFDGETSLEYPLEKMLVKMDNYESIEPFIADLFTMKFFSIE